MSRLTIGFAAAVSVAAGLSLFALDRISPGVDQTQLIASLAAFAVLLRVLFHARGQAGRVTTAVGWLVLAGGLLVIEPDWPLFVLGHVALLWLARAAFLHTSLKDRLLDLTLTSAATVFAAWAWLSSQNLALAIWCWLLPHSISIDAIAAWLPTFETDPAEPSAFDQAAQTADAALRRIAGRQPIAEIEPD
jgi:hypothetical protein